MLRALRVIGVPVVVGLVLSASCTFKDPNQVPDAGGSGSGGAESGEGGGSSSSKAGTTSKGGSSGGKSAGTAGAGAESGAGGDSGAGPQCPECESGFCLEDGTCVTCLPSDDQCPAAQYCTEANECEAGCKADGSSCASGVCNAEHNCENCINDDECVAPLVCGNGQCAAACTVAQEGTTNGCDGGLTCCSLHCTDLPTSSEHCGACSNACDAGQFCGVTTCPIGGEGGAGGTDPTCVACHDTTLANICSISKIIVILDSAEGNRATGRAIGAALATQCMPTPELTEAEQDSVEALNLTTGRPVSGGGELLVVAGGPFYQNLEGYLEDQRIAPLYWFVGDDFSEFRRSSDDEPIATLPIAGDHDSHDYFIIQFMRDPASGSLALNAQGLWLSGTVAAAHQITNGFLPNLSVLDKAWYAYEWTDGDGDLGPDDAEISLVASGP